MEEILSSIRRIIADEETGEANAEEEKAASPEAGTSTLETLEVLDDEEDHDDDQNDDNEDDSSDILELTSVVDEAAAIEEPVEDDEIEEDLTSATLELVGDTVDEDDIQDEEIEIADIDDLPEVVDMPEVTDLDEEEIDEPEDVVPEIETVLMPEDDDLEDIDMIETTTIQEDEPAVSTKKVETEALLSTGTASTTTGAFAKLSKAFRPTPVEESVADGAGRTVEQFIEDMARPMLKEWLDENMPAIVERLVQKEIQKIARRAELL